jgi:hypothetical protein
MFACFGVKSDILDKHGQMRPHYSAYDELNGLDCEVNGCYINRQPNTNPTTSESRVSQWWKFDDSLGLEGNLSWKK